MPRTFVLRRTSPDSARSPELTYLVSWVDLQLARAFGEGLVLPAAGSLDELPATPGPGDRVVVLGNERLLVTTTSLEAMARALPAGGGVIPTALATHPAAGRPVHTLRGYERLEAVLLEQPPPPAPASPLPLSLATAEALAGLDEAMECWAALAEGSAEPFGGAPVARAGLYHEFIDYYGQVRSDIREHLPPDVHSVLDVGCGRGGTGAWLRDELGCTVTGVELNPVVAGEARRHLDRVVVGDIEDPAVTAEVGGPFDLVLALELFEHLAEPERFLEQARKLLRPGGAILISTPNVGHWSVVEDLLAGRWDYLPVGLLCYTHLRFFTRRTLEDWLEREGLTDYTITPQESEESPHLEALEGAVELDRESLRTKGFYVRIGL